MNVIEKRLEELKVQSSQLKEKLNSLEALRLKLRDQMIATEGAIAVCKELLESSSGESNGVPESEITERSV